MNRILIVDDNPAIHEDFRKVLDAAPEHPQLDELEASMFGSEVQAPAGAFELVHAHQGQEAVAVARAAASEGRPFSVAFVDIRMPPGWDGVETTARLWEVDSRLQVVICSAYSDYSWQEMRSRLGSASQLLILKKPFDPIEVLQLAHALAEKWMLLLASQRTMAELESTVTERTEALKAAEARLAQAQKLEALGRLAGGIAHEINNPLSVVSSNVRFLDSVVKKLQAPVPLSEDLGQASKDALNAAERIRRIVEEVKLFARAECTAVTSIDLVHVVERALAISHAEVSARARLSVVMEPVPAVSGREEGLVQVLYNLLTNAASALDESTPGQNEIRLSVGPSSDGRVAISIHDNGCGISAANLPRVFEPFFTTKEVGFGTGLGLSICHGIVTSLGGEIRVESVPGSTTFRILLAIATPDAAERAA